MSDWDTDRTIVLAGVELLNVCVLKALSLGLDPIAMTWIDQVRVLAKDFGEEPDQMGAGVATLWQDRAIELSNPAIDSVGETTKALAEAGLQLAAIVNELARRHGGRRWARFGYAVLRVTTRVSDRDHRLDVVDPHPQEPALLAPRDMLDFLAARARDLHVPQEVIISKLARRGL